MVLYHNEVRAHLLNADNLPHPKLHRKKSQEIEEVIIATESDDYKKTNNIINDLANLKVEIKVIEYLCIIVRKYQT